MKAIEMPFGDTMMMMVMMGKNIAFMALVFKCIHL